MGRLEFEGWNVTIDNLAQLNSETEISRLGLIFKIDGDCTYAEAEGNTAVVYLILGEVKKHIIEGSFTVIQNAGNGENIKYTLSSSFVLENKKDITKIID